MICHIKWISSDRTARVNIENQMQDLSELVFDFSFFSFAMIILSKRSCFISPHDDPCPVREAKQIAYFLSSTQQLHTYLGDVFLP